MLKTPIYRNPKLLALAKESPHCMCCGKHNDGDVVACHSNRSRDGKSLGKKSSDAAIFYGCYFCHVSYDESGLPKAQKDAMFNKAHMATMRWLIESGHLVVAKPH